MKNATTTKPTAKTSTQNDLQKAAELAIGRILRMGSRPAQPGDVEEYERCRRIVMDACGEA